MADLIGLTGPAGSGKSYCARIFIQKYDFYSVKFADPLKLMLTDLLRYSGMSRSDIRRHVEGDLKEAPCEVLSGRSSRFAQQTIGTEWGRVQMHPDFWTNIAAMRIKKMLRNRRDVIVDDVRFENEARLIRDLGGKVYKVTGRRHTIPAGTHVSEAGISPHLISGTLNNTGLEELAMSEVTRIIQGYSE